MSSVNSSNNSISVIIKSNKNTTGNKKFIEDIDKFTHEFYKEKFERNRKYYLRHHVVDTHIPNLKALPLATKFYSKYDQPIENEQTLKCRQVLEQKFYSGPKDKYTKPMLENQKYGWISDPLMKFDHTDYGILYRPKLKNDLTRIGEIISREKITERPNFNGLQFKLVV